MSPDSNLIRSSLAIGATLVALGLFGSTASAQMPKPTSSTPSIIGGQVIGGGHLTAGMSTGYPTTRGEFIFGISNKFDLGVFPGLTYGRRVSGIHQHVGLLLDVPLRFNLATLPKAAIALRVVPYFRIGQEHPAVGVGGVVGVRVSMPLPKIFSIVFGAETRLGFGSFGGNCPAGVDCRDNFFDGATYGLLGLESFFKNKWFFFFENDFGGWYRSNGNGGGGHGLYNAHIGFGAMLH